jgi:hypothetical protein
MLKMIMRIILKTPSSSSLYDQSDLCKCLEIVLISIKNAFGGRCDDTIFIDIVVLKLK